MVECTGLENRRTLIAFPGFESLVSRQDLHKSLAYAGLLCFWDSSEQKLKSLIVSASFLAVSATYCLPRSARRLHTLLGTTVNRYVGRSSLLQTVRQRNCSISHAARAHRSRRAAPTLLVLHPCWMPIKPGDSLFSWRQKVSLH